MTSRHTTPTIGTGSPTHVQFRHVPFLCSVLRLYSPLFSLLYTVTVLEPSRLFPPAIDLNDALGSECLSSCSVAADLGGGSFPENSGEELPASEERGELLFVESVVMISTFLMPNQDDLQYAIQSFTMDQWAPNLHWHSVRCVQSVTVLLLKFCQKRTTTCCRSSCSMSRFKFPVVDFILCAALTVRH